MRDNCGLCVRAKSALSHVWDRRPFDFKEVNITHPEAKPWKDIYDFDVPAVSIRKTLNPSVSVLKDSRFMSLSPTPLLKTPRLSPRPSN